MKKTFNSYLIAFTVLLLSSCKKDYLETNPSDQAPTQLVFSTTDGAYVALNGLYRNQYVATDVDVFGQKSTDLVSDLMGNDMVVNSAGYNWFNGEYRYTAQLTTVTGDRSDATWAYYYSLINAANNILANIDAATGAPADRDNIKGQALAVRAYSYYYLVNFMQHTYKGNETKPGVPLYTTPSSEGKARGTVQEVYAQIITDLGDAETLLTGKARKHISHINVNTVQGIRARVALQMEDYANAASYANKARQGYTPMTASQYLQGFSSVTNPEWIWGLQVINDQSSILASFFSHIDVTVYGYAQAGNMQKKITKALYDQIPDGDIRKEAFHAPGTGPTVDPDYNQNKFRVPDPSSWAGDYVLMRAAEMYLIEAEALARTGGQEANARAVLEELVGAREPGYSAAGLSGTALVNEVLLQRRIELWGEGFSLFDIKRLKTGLNRPTGPGNHGSPNLNPNIVTLADQDPRFLMRIPQRELDANESMSIADQNP